MCGIAGILSKDSRLITKERLKQMTDSIAHRGPDGEGQWINEEGTTGLANRRLAIIDRSEAGKQPMHFLNRYTITYNGEIYNYKELRNQLQKQGYTFHSHTDTEVVMAMYDWKKSDCLNDLDGMFAFALYDEKEKQLFCARDRFGEKPLYYASNSTHFIFGSEMKAIWAVGVSRVVNEKMLYRYLVYNEEINAAAPSETFYKDIQKLPAAHYLYVAQDLSVRVQQYWNIDPALTDTTINEKQAADKFKDLLHTSVQRRLRSDVATGTSLSGGLDSSIVLKMIDSIDKESSQTIHRHAFSAQFPGFIKDESYYQQLVINQTGFTHHVATPTMESMLANLDNIFYHQEEPFGSASINAQYEVYALAKQNNITVLLDGQGADEILAGYPGEYFVPFIKELKGKDKWDQLIAFKKLYKKNTINPAGRLLWKAMLPSSLTSVLRSWVKPTDTTWLNKDFVHAYQQEQKEEKESSSLNNALYTSVFGGGLETLLRYADRNAMAHGVEIRLPFLYHELVHFLFTLPSSFKIHNGWTKWISRYAFEGQLPEEIIWRKEKIGFEPPDKNFEKSFHTFRHWRFANAAGSYINEKNVTEANAWQLLMSQCLLNSY